MSRRRREDDFTIAEDEQARAMRLGRPKLADHPLVQARASTRTRRHRSIFTGPSGGKVTRKKAHS